MMKRIISILLIIIIFTFRSLQAEIVNRVVAFVNNDIITLYELEMRMQETTGYLPSKLKEMDPEIYLNRVDTAVDKMIDEKITSQKIEELRERLKSLRGRAGVANSRIIYSKYREIFSGQEFRDLNAKGVNVQRLLWGSTGTKDPAYSDIKYVTELMGKGTINTLPDHTLHAFIDHGTIEDTLSGDISEAIQTLNTLREFDIDIDVVCLRLLDEGVKAFQKSFQSLLKTIDEKKRAYTVA